MDKMKSELGDLLTIVRHQERPTRVEDLKKLAQQDPAFGAAFRTIVDTQISPEDLLKLAEGKPKRDEK
jgi:hypothetical protein